MNFLLYMLGRVQGAAGLRPTAREMLLSGAAAHACAGRTVDALSAYRRLGQAAKITPLDLLVRGHLHLTLKHYSAAQRYFTRGADRLLSRQIAMNGTDSSDGNERGAGQNVIEQLLSQADAYLRRGRFVRAGELLQLARSMLDMLLSAHAGVVIAQADAGGISLDTDSGMCGVESTLPRLAQLGDLCLRLLARTHLAIHLARSMHEKRLREDLASWAITGACVDGLLAAECDRLSAAALEAPEHAELHYRLGLVARAAHRLDVAANAFRQTLRLHPHHVASATRLAATLRQLHRPADELPVLRQAFQVPPETLRRYAAFAGIAGDTTAFDRAVDRLCDLQADEKAGITARSNLAFTLSELAILDPVRAAWREPAAV